MICGYTVFLHTVFSDDQAFPSRKETKSAKLPTFFTSATIQTAYLHFATKAFISSFSPEPYLEYFIVILKQKNIIPLALGF
jgi:hypothetical protein